MFGGINTITASYYDPLFQANVVEFTITEDTSLALLLRADATGEEIVDDLEDVTTGIVHEVLDYSFLPGPNDYRVRTGSGVNGWEQTDAVTILN